MFEHVCIDATFWTERLSEASTGHHSDIQESVV